MFVIMAVATDTRAVGEAAAIAIGGTVGLDAMFGGPISGASMNPARSIGPARSGNLHALWLYIVAPIVGASFAAVTYKFIRGELLRTTPTRTGLSATARLRSRLDHRQPFRLRRLGLDGLHDGAVHAIRDLVGVDDRNLLEPGRLQPRRVLALRQGVGDATNVASPVGTLVRGQAILGDNVTDPRSGRPA